MEMILGMLSKFFADIFSTVIIEQLKTPGETFEVLDETGTIEHSNDIDDILSRFDGVHNRD